MFNHDYFAATFFAPSYFPPTDIPQPQFDFAGGSPRRWPVPRPAEDFGDDDFLMFLV